MRQPRRLSLVLPLRIDPDRTVSDLDRFLALGLPSFHRFFDPALVQELIVLAPAEDSGHLNRELQAHCKFRFRIIDDAHVCPSIAGARGWYKQQILKLAVASFVETEWYLTLDADVLCVRNVDSSFFFPDGRAIWQKELANQHQKWWDGSRALLESVVQIDGNSRVIGVTPALLRTASVLGLISQIGERAKGKDWAAFLLESYQLRWSEYSLYWTYLVEHNDADKFYSDSTNVLYASSGSIWLKEDFGKLDAQWLEQIFDSNAGHAFIVFQSNLELSLAAAVRLLRPRLGGSPTPSLDEMLRWQRHRIRHYVRKVRNLAIRAMRRIFHPISTPD